MYIRFLLMFFRISFDKSSLVYYKLILVRRILYAQPNPHALLENIVKKQKKKAIENYTFIRCAKQIKFRFSLSRTISLQQIKTGGSLLNIFDVLELFNNPFVEHDVFFWNIFFSHHVQFFNVLHL